MKTIKLWALLILGLSLTAAAPTMGPGCSCDAHASQSATSQAK